jgi:hypothetical protein
MSLSAPAVPTPSRGATSAESDRPRRAPRHRHIATWARGYFASDAARTLQSALGLLWLLDGALQFQSYMYGNGFVQMLRATADGQPPWVTDSMHWATGVIQAHQTTLNTMFALLQVALGLGLLYRRTVKLSLLASFAWAVALWWFGEGFGMLFMNMTSPLSGAPGAAILYVLVGALAWPAHRPGGLLGVRWARIAWATLWLVMAWLWLSAAGTMPNAVSEAINGAPSGIGWVTSMQQWFVTATEGHGLVIGLVLAGASASIAVAVARDWHGRAFLILAIELNVLFWILGQGLGGIFAGGATDPNAAPLFILLACGMYPLAGLSGLTGSGSGGGCAAARRPAHPSAGAPSCSGRSSAAPS